MTYELINTVIAAGFLIALFAVVVIKMERTHHREAGMPHAPYGGEAKRDLDLFRVLHDLSARGRG